MVELIDTYYMGLWIGFLTATVLWLLLFQLKDIIKIGRKNGRQNK